MTKCRVAWAWGFRSGRTRATSGFGENWQAAIQEGFEGTAAFVAIVSPRYQNSQWCARERNEFRRRFKPEEFGTSGRFFKAVKTPWPDNAHRFFLQEIQAVDFCKDGPDGHIEFTPGSRDFKRAVRKLADGVELLLRRMRRANQRVHVAWPVEECLVAWEQLSDELRSKGFDVQPMGPRDDSFADNLLIQDIDQAVLSIHLLGSVYDRVLRTSRSAGRRSRTRNDVLDLERRGSDDRRASAGAYRRHPTGHAARQAGR